MERLPGMSRGAGLASDLSDHRRRLPYRAPCISHSISISSTSASALRCCGVRAAFRAASRADRPRRPRSRAPPPRLLLSNRVQPPPHELVVLLLLLQHLVGGRLEALA